MLELLIKGGVLMIPIVIASIVSVTLIIERFIYWRKQKDSNSPIEMIRLVEAGKFDEFLKKGDASNGPVMRVLKAGIIYRVHQATLAMEAEAIKEMKEMNKHLPALDTIITLAPLLGLLGTIIGMIQSFGVMSSAGLGHPLAVTGGISEALIATAAGLIVAITTLIPYNYFLSKAEKTTEDIERYATRLEMVLIKAEMEEQADSEGFITPALN